MTNEQIIFNARCQLMEEGLIGTTGRTLVMEMEDGTTKTVPEPEEIHTYAFWKQERGLQVKHGEHAVCTLQIWKCKKKKKKEAQEDDKEIMFLTKGFFFSQNQVEAVQ
ncbi:MAG: hypothetical protein K6E63_07190 [Lachnospiraceae bacterium]|nr:hypothetical protein [Lachnospiraceae bacterium]